MPPENAAKLKTVSETKVIRCNTVSIYTYGGEGAGGRGMALKGCINKTNITKYSRRHLSYFLCPTALPCPLGRGLCSLFLRAVYPIHRSCCDESFHLFIFLKIHQMGICSFLHGDVCGVCSGACIMLVLSVCGHPSIHHRSLLEVGVVRKGIDVLLDHFVAELVLLLRKGRGETATSD